MRALVLPVRPARRPAALLAALVVALAGCGPAGPRHLALDEIVVEAQPDANGNSALSVDVALATQPGIAEILAKLPATEWFKRKTQLQRDFPDGLSVLSWELIPGQTARAAPKGEALDGYVFAAYAGAGEHRVRLMVEGRATRIVLQASDFLVQPQKGDSR